MTKIEEHQEGSHWAVGDADRAAITAKERGRRVSGASVCLAIKIP